MLSRGIRKYVSNPLIGLLPFILFVILRTFEVNGMYALIASIGLAIIGELLIRIIYKNSGFSISFYVSGISLLITLVVWIFTSQHVQKPFTYVVVCEILIICSFMLIRVSKVYISSIFFRQKNLLQKALINEYYDSMTLIQYALTLHVFGILLYRQFTINKEYSDAADIIIFSVIPISFILIVGVYQILKVSRLVSKLKREEWLPIVTEKGEVTGKIAKSVSLNMKNKFLHPVVRVALVSDSKVFLQERSSGDILDPGKLDYPFEKYMLFNHEINLAARNSIRKMVGDRIDIPIKFLLKYVFENADTRRLVFLFVAKIDDEDMIRRDKQMTGKFWTVKQMEDGFADGVFSECFELEFEYLKNTELIPTDIFDKSTV
ncbi:MAG: hypothetical protein LBV43_11715 [Prevotella sp.]|jgi:hypothetical protein|nr:hypothetical protein [Prevotella sp.]